MPRAVSGRPRDVEHSRPFDFAQGRPRLCSFRVAIAAAFILTSAAPPTNAAARRPHGKAVIVVLHGVSWEELAAAKVPPLQELLRQAAVGAMNSRALGEPGWDSAYVTIGAGRVSVYDPRFESTPPPPACWIAEYVWHDRASALAAIAQQRAHTQAVPELLAATLKCNDLSTARRSVSSGTAWSIHAPRGADVILRERGDRRIPPGGRVAGTAFLDAAADLQALDLVDFLHRPGPAPTTASPDPQAVSLLRAHARLFADIAPAMSPARDLLIIISPTCPPYGSPKHMSLAPIAVIGPGFAPGLLTSQSTRQPGMVSSADIAPTILRFFGLKAPAAMSGHPIVERPASKPLAAVLAISRRGVRLFDLQWRLVPVYVIGEFTAFMGVVAALALAPAWASRRRRFLHFVLLAGMSLPLALLFLGPLDPGGVAAPYLIVAALAMLFGWAAWVGAPPLTALGVLLTATSAVVALDGIMGTPLLGRSLLNFGAMSGSRFYGIGNETMGAVVASAAVGSAALVQEAGASRLSLWAMGLWLAFVAVVIGAPSWGANWGGIVTAAFAFTVAYAGIRAGRPRLRHWAPALGVAAAAGALAVYLDMIADAATRSHIGDTARLVSAGGLPAAIAVIARNAHADLRIVALAPYAVVALAVLAAVLWLVVKPPAVVRATLLDRPVLRAGLAGGTAGALMAVLIEDSGIVAAASALGIIASALAYVALERGTLSSRPAA